MSQVVYLLKQASASLKHKPGFVATVIVTMGTTLGALLCILTLAYLLLLKPLPYPDQEKLYLVDHVASRADGRVMGKAFVYPSLISLYEKQQVFSETALLYYGEDVLTTLPNQPSMSTTYVTPEWFPLYQTSFVMGRGFEQTEAIDSNNPVAILSYQTWQKEFGLDPDILSKKIAFSGVSFKIIGVVSQSFVEPQIHGTGISTGVWLPWDFNPDTQLKNSWGLARSKLVFVGKLKPSLTVAQAQQSMTQYLNKTWQDNTTDIAFFKGWSLSMELNSFATVILGESQNIVYLLLAGVLGLVVIASANIANLFISRTAQQQRQLAIHAALGAKKSQLFASLLAESGLLMLVSIIVALLIASLGFTVFQQYLSSLLPRISELSINLMTLSMAVIIAVLLALVFAGVSTKMINYKALNSVLQSSGKGTGIQVSKRFRQWLIASQVAIVTVLVFANISVFKHAVDEIKMPLGFNLDNTTYLTVTVAAPVFPPQEEMVTAMRLLQQKLSELPQVVSVSQATSPLGNVTTTGVTVLGTDIRFTPEITYIDQNYFEMLEQPLLEGKNFSAAEVKDNSKILIVNDVFAKQLAPQGSALGLQIDFGRGFVFTVTGVVKGIKMPGESDIPVRIYNIASLATSYMLIKLHENQHISREQAVSIMSEVNSVYAVSGLESLDDNRYQRLFTQITTAIITAVLAILIFFLAGIGLHGVLSYSTQMRQFELGTRMAIGAKRKDLITLIIRDNAQPIIAGVVIGIGVMVALYVKFSETLLEYVSGQLIPMSLITLLLIGVISALACYLPLRQYINRPVIHSLRGSE